MRTTTRARSRLLGLTLAVLAATTVPVALPPPVVAAPAVADGFRPGPATPTCVRFPSDRPVARVAGEDRWATAACAARAGHPHGAATVVLARGDDAGDHADALAGTVLAHAEDAPVLLTGPRSLAAAARDALVDLAPDRVLVLGGPVAIADRVVAEVDALVGEVTRVAGATRAGTAAAIAARVPGDDAFVVNGHRPADALTAGAAAARAGAALLLVEPGGVPAETRDALAQRTDLTIVGGPGVVDGDLERAIRDLVPGEVRRLGGPTRYETAATVARVHPGDGTIHLVSGADAHLVDAIAAGWIAAAPDGGPVVYTTRDAPDRATDRYLRLGALVGAPWTRVFGGPVSIAAPMVDALEERYAEAAHGGPPAQQRGVWVHMFDDDLKTRTGIEEVLDTAVAANLNTVVVQATRRHDAYYDSDVLPQTTDPALEDGLDVLDTLVPAAHARGLQVHVWWSLTPTTHESMEDEDLGPHHVNTRHGAGSPDPWVATGWIDGHELLDPAIPGVQQHVVDMVTEVVRRHDVDGVHLDDLHYACLQAVPGGCATGAEAGDPATHNQHPVTMARWRDHGDGQPLADFMRAQTEDLLRRVLLEVGAIDPSVVVSGALIAQGEGPTGPDPISDFEDTIAHWNTGQDWRRWVREGLLDHAYPMAYVRESEPTHAVWFDQWTAFADLLDTPDHVTAIGQAAYLNCVEDSLSQLRQALAAVDGATVYSLQGDSSGACGESEGQLVATLAAPDGPFATPAPVPDVPRRTAPRTGHVLVEARDGARVELVPLADDGHAETRRADATGHAGFVDVAPGDYLVGVEGGGAEPVTVRAGRVSRVG